VGAWGTGLYDDDDACDLRDAWRDLLQVGFSAAEITSHVLRRAQVDADDDDQSGALLALADLQWKAGLLQPRVRRRALQLIAGEVDLERWPDPKHRDRRRRLLVGLGRRLRSRMPAVRPVRLHHPTDWKWAEHVLWRTADGGSAALRVVGFDPKYGGGGSPVFELVGASGPGVRPGPKELRDAKPRTAVNSLTLASGRRWQGTRFAVGMFEPGSYRAGRVQRLSPTAAKRRLPVPRGVLGTRWDGLDGFLFRAFELPWPRGTVLRVANGGAPILLVVVDIGGWMGDAETLCAVVDERGEVGRTADTLRRVRARIVDPGSLPSLAKHRRQFGVRDLDERIPYRVRLLGRAPSGVQVVGRQKILPATAYDANISWSELGSAALAPDQK
jgi:hypothetical protein